MRTVASTTTSLEGFNQRRISRLRWRRWFRALTVFVVLSVPVAFVSYQALDFLARTPRERRMVAKSFWDRVSYGASMNAVMAWNWLTAEQDDPKGSRLPVFELYIRKERLNALKAHLPQSGRVFHPGLFKARRKGEPNVVLPANLRFRGDSMNHWAFPQKSWRVKLKRQARFMGMRQFNLYLPRSKSQIPDFLGYQLAESMGGMVVPKAFPVHLRLNRNFDGLRVFLEQVNEDFFTNHNLSADRMLVGDIDFEDVYGNKQRERLFQGVSGWEITPLHEGGATHATELARLVAAIPLVSTDPGRFKTELEAVLDVSGTLRYMAYLEIVNSVHVDDTHNQRFFFDTSSQRLRPIVWDPVAYLREHSDDIDIGENELFIAMLQIPEYRDEKNRYVWEALNGPLRSDRVAELIRASAEAIRPEVMASPQKIYTHRINLGILFNSEWKGAVEEVVERSQKRNAVLIEALRKVSVQAKGGSKSLPVDEVSVLVGGDAGVAVREFVFDAPERSSRRLSVSISGRGGESRKEIRFDEVRKGFVCSVSDFIASNRRVDKNGDLIRESGVVTYRVSAEVPEVRLREIHGVNSVTGEAISVGVNRR